MSGIVNTDFYSKFMGNQGYQNAMQGTNIGNTLQYSSDAQNKLYGTQVKQIEQNMELQNDYKNSFAGKYGNAVGLGMQAGGLVLGGLSYVEAKKNNEKNAENIDSQILTREGNLKIAQGELSDKRAGRSTLAAAFSRQ